MPSRQPSRLTPNLPILFILVTIAIDAMGFGLIMPVMPGLLIEVRAGSLAEAAIWGGLLSTSFAVMQFLFGPAVGNLSDRFGRRPVLLTALGVMALDYAVMAVASSIWLLLVLRTINGIAAATQSTAAAAMADLSKPEEKAARFGLLGAAFGIGFVLGPMLGGLLAGYGTRAPFIAAATLAAANLGLGALILPETVTDRIRRPFSWRRANPFGALAAIGRLAGVRPLLAVYLLYQIAFFVYPAVWSFFATERFQWSTSTIGLSLAAFGIGMVLVQGMLMKPILKRLGETRTAIFGLGFSLVAFLTFGFVTSGTMALALIPLAAVGMVVNPALQGTLSRSAKDDQQGELQGLLTSINAVALILSPALMTQTFAAFTGAGAVYLPGAPFLVAAALTAVCLAIYLPRRRFALA